MSVEYVIGKIEDRKLYYFGGGAIVTDYAEASKYYNIKHADQVLYMAREGFSDFKVFEMSADSILRVISELHKL